MNMQKSASKQNKPAPLHHQYAQPRRNHDERNTHPISTFRTEVFLAVITIDAKTRQNKPAPLHHRTTDMSNEPRARHDETNTHPISTFRIPSSTVRYRKKAFIHLPELRTVAQATYRCQLFFFRIFTLSKPRSFENPHSCELLFLFLVRGVRYGTVRYGTVLRGALTPNTQHSTFTTQHSTPLV